jgi:IS5 family transposase
MGSGRDRVFYSGKHKRHGVNVQVLADPVGRLIWASPALPGHRHYMGAAREHGLIDALTHAGVQVVADNGYRGAGPNFDLPQRRRRADPGTGARRRLSDNQRAVNAAHAAQRGLGERANAVFKSWKIFRKIRCCPHRATTLVDAVQVLILAG